MILGASRLIYSAVLESFPLSLRCVYSTVLLFCSDSTTTNSTDSDTCVGKHAGPTAKTGASQSLSSDPYCGGEISRQEEN